MRKYFKGCLYLIFKSTPACLTRQARVDGEGGYTDYIFLVARILCQLRIIIQGTRRYWPKPMV